MLPFDGEAGAEEGLRFLEKKAGAGLWCLELGNRTMAWSDGLYTLLGFEPRSVEPSYATIVDLMHPDDRRPAGEFDRIVSEGLPLDRELRIIQPNGKLRWLSSRTEVHLDKSGRPMRALGVMLDVTMLHEIALAKSALDSRFRALVAATKAFVWTADAEGNLLEIRNWVELRGENPTNILGSRWIDLIHPTDRERTLECWKSAVTGKHEYETEHQLRQPDGSYRWMLTRAAPIMQENGNVREWVGVSSDIHETKVWPAIGGRREAVLTGAQIRAGRAVVNWSVRELSETAGVSSSTIRRLEENNGTPSSVEPALEPIQRTLEQAGVEFFFPPVGKPGVRPS